MVSKTTLRIPEPLMRKLRERSARDGLSINEAAMRALERGLGGRATEDDRWLALAPLLERVPATRYDAEEMRRLRADVSTSARELEDALDWVRGDAP